MKFKRYSVSRYRNFKISKIQSLGTDMTSNISHNALVFAFQKLVSNIQFNKSCLECSQVFVTISIFCNNMQTKIKYWNYSQALYFSRLLIFVDIIIFTGSIQRNMPFDFVYLFVWMYLRDHNLIGRSLLLPWIQTKLSYNLKNLKLFSIRVKELSGPIVLWRKGDGFKLFL